MVDDPNKFSNRAIIVRRIRELNPEYQHDVELIEGEYHGLDDLQKRIQELNLLYGFPDEKIFELIWEKTRHSLFDNSIAFNFKGRGGSSRISAEEVYTVLDDAGIVYLRYNLVARPDGVYDDRTLIQLKCHPHPVKVDERKVADITLKLVG